VTGPICGMVQRPPKRSLDFIGSAIRLLKRLTPQRGPVTAVIGRSFADLLSAMDLAPALLIWLQVKMLRARCSGS
jgi:hypothetical protein